MKTSVKLLHRQSKANPSLCFSKAEPEAEGPIPGRKLAYTERKSSTKRKLLGLMGAEKNFDQVCTEAGLSEVERKILRFYVLEDKTVYEAAELADRCISSIYSILLRVVNKLNGKSPYEHRVEKFRRLGPNGVDSLLDMLRVTSRADLRYRYPLLAQVAAEFGVLDKRFPKPKTQIDLLLEKIADEVGRLKESGKLEEMISHLKKPEKLAVRALAHGKQIDFSSDPSLENAAKEKSNFLKILLSKLTWSLEATKTLRALRAELQNMGSERLEVLMPRLTPIERSIIERRALTPDPDSLQDIGDTYSYTRECIRQKERALLTKLQNLRN